MRYTKMNIMLCYGVDGEVLIQTQLKKFQLLDFVYFLQNGNFLHFSAPELVREIA